MSHANCPVCQEDLHTSREPCQIPPCHHLLHKSCFDRLLANNHFYCPICYGSLMDLSPIWKLYKKQIQNNPMPERYQVHTTFNTLRLVSLEYILYFFIGDLSQCDVPRLQLALQISLPCNRIPLLKMQWFQYSQSR